jgi:hypothetical protein
MYSSKKFDRVHIVYSSTFDDISKYGIKVNSGAILSQGVVIGNNSLSYPGNLTYSANEFDSMYYTNTTDKQKILSIPAGITWTENKLLKTSATNCNFSDIDVDDYNNITNIATIGGITGNITNINSTRISCLLATFGTVGVSSLIGTTLAFNNIQGNLTLIPGNVIPTSTSNTFGAVGNVIYDNDYLYIKTSNGWKRIGLDTF